jgi:hypothetical protein
MNLRLKLGSVMMLGLLLMPVADADVPAKAQREVDFLLGYVETAGCEFYRNGTWHDGKAAQEHLSDKYHYLAARNLINTAEDFIDMAATKSSFSGLPYQVKCNGGAPMASNPWLREALARFRKL